MRRAILLALLLSRPCAAGPGDVRPGAGKPEIFVQLGHANYVQAVAFSPDGRLALSAGRDYTLILWDVATGKEIRQLIGHKHWVTCAAFSPDGKRALSGDFDHAVRLWDIATGKELQRFTKHKSPVDFVAFSPDGRLALSGSGSETADAVARTLILWDLSTGDEVRRFTEDVLGVHAAAFSPDGRSVLSANGDRTVTLWDASTGKKLKRSPLPWAGAASVFFVGDRGLALFGTEDNALVLWDASAGKEIRRFSGSTTTITAVALSRDAQFAASGDNVSLKVWEVSTGRKAGEFTTKERPWFYSLAFSPDARYVLAGLYGDSALRGGASEAVMLWDVAAGKLARELAGRSNLVTSVAFSPDGHYAVSGSLDKAVRLWDLRTGAEVRRFLGHADVVLCVAFSPDGKRVLSGSQDKTTRLWDVATGSEVARLAEQSGAAAFSRDGQSILSYTTVEKSVGWESKRSHHLRLLDASTLKERRLFAALPEYIRSIALSPDGRAALSSSDDKVVRLWDTAAGTEVRRLEGHPGRPASVAFSPDGRLAAAASGELSADETYRAAVTLWDAATGGMVRRLAGGQDVITSLAFSPDGKRLLTGNMAADVDLWDVRTGQRAGRLRGHLRRVNAVAFSPDGARALSGGDDGALRLWDAGALAELAQLIGLGDGEWITITPEGYYSSSLYGHENINVRMGLEVYGIDQFYDVFYRPDIVAAKLRGNDIRGLATITIDDALQDPPPTVAFTGGVKDTDRSQADVCYRVKSAGGGIGEVRLFHNGKLVASDGYYRDLVRAAAHPPPLTAMNGRAIYQDMRDVAVKGTARAGPLVSGTKGEVVEDCRQVDAVPGDNEVSLAAFNRKNTVQSSMKTARFRSTAAPAPPHLYILSIGIDRYKDAGVNLRFAAKDARDIRDKLLDRSATLFKPEDIHAELLADERATKPAILAKIDELSAKARPTDGFILFAAGHGVLLQNQYYLLTHDFDGAFAAGGMLSSNEIVEMSKKIKSLSQLLIFDTCHAGGVDTIVSGLYDARMSVLAKKMGLHVYASANSIQAALDGYQGNGLFSAALLEGLSERREADADGDGSIGREELGEYARARTEAISGRLGRSQTPLIISFGKDGPLYKLK
ncbi:MAG: caspase family protein [Elusimicrobia bacterium]|nr:caspase family protein [Elusimicrobiota bacterium]